MLPITVRRRERNWEEEPEHLEPRQTGEAEQEAVTGGSESVFTPAWHESRAPLWSQDDHSALSQLSRQNHSGVGTGPGWKPRANSHSLMIHWSLWWHQFVRITCLVSSLWLYVILWTLTLWLTLCSLTLDGCHWTESSVPGPAQCGQPEPVPLARTAPSSSGPHDSFSLQLFNLQFIIFHINRIFAMETNQTGKPNKANTFSKTFLWFKKLHWN